MQTGGAIKQDLGSTTSKFRVKRWKKISFLFFEIHFVDHVVDCFAIGCGAMLVLVTLFQMWTTATSRFLFRFRLLHDLFSLDMEMLPIFDKNFLLLTLRLQNVIWPQFRKEFSSFEFYFFMRLSNLRRHRNRKKKIHEVQIAEDIKAKRRKCLSKWRSLTHCLSLSE